MIVFNPPVDPAIPTTRDVQTRVLRAELGDGYSVRVTDGLNSIVNTMNVVWDLLSTADADTIEAFFEARGGAEAFEWTPPYASAPKKFIASSWSIGNVGPGFVSLNATFEQVFDL